MAQYCLSNTLGRPTKRLGFSYSVLSARPAVPASHAAAQAHTARPLLLARLLCCSCSRSLIPRARRLVPPPGGRLLVPPTRSTALLPA
jgi:hypothetical protein